MNHTTESKYRVYVSKMGGNLRVCLQQGFEFINWDKYINRDTRVFVKPNFTFPRYKEGVTTNPRLLRHLLEILKEKACTVIVGESDGGNHSFKAEEAFEGHNMYQICRDIGVGLVNLSSLPVETIKSKILGKTVEIQLPKLLLEEIDCFVSVPVLKVHVMTTVSLSLKNSWGCVPDTMRCLNHQNLAYKLTLLARVLQPRIVVIDGTYALDKHGPMYGEPIKRDLLVLADNSVVADAIGARLMGFIPRKVEHIALAERTGLGTADWENVEINKDWMPYIRRHSIKRTVIDRLSSLLFRSDTIARLVMVSPLTPIIYRLVRFLRSPGEKEVADQMGVRNKIGSY